MQDIRVGVIQMNALLGKVDENLAAHVEWIQKAAKKKAELICFPELSVSGHYCAGEVWACSEPVPDGPSTQALIDVAAELGVFVSFGVAEREANIAYNTQVIVGPDGYLGKQRKLHMSGDEYFHFRSGTQIPTINIGKCKLGIGICYDNIFPEVSRIAAVRGAEVYLMPHAARFGQWPEKKDGRAAAVKRGKKTWSRVYAARAYDNGMYIVFCNQAGVAGDEPPTSHAGGILVFGPDGELIKQSRTKEIQDEMVIVDLKADVFDARRKGSCFNLQTRKPELYGALTKLTD
jgi:N-carbamoylputrescine amidase